MMSDSWKRLNDLARLRGRYAPLAYAFVVDVLGEILSRDGVLRPMNAPEILEGFRLAAGREFGGLAPSVLRSWGMSGTGDIGEIVFHLVDEGVLQRSADDDPEHFRDAYDFLTAFEDADPDAPPGEFL